MTSKNSRDRVEVLVGSRLGVKSLHVVVYIDGQRFTMSIAEAKRMRRGLKRTIRYIRDRS